MEAQKMAGHMIRRLHQLSTQVFTRRIHDAGFDLTPVQFAAMDAITSAPGIDQAGIAHKIAYDRATIGGVIDRLEQKGLVTRNVSRQDRRAREVWPTDAGVEAYCASLPVVNAVQDEILAGLTDPERALFMQLATKALTAAADVHDD
ncbi:MAG: MarR family transcriptional regulator [Maritimibacter sp.]|nr:MarR family transcriptional regulator [Maritimibacter sp.]